MNFEEEIINYLKDHGNTRQSDLIEFGTHSLHFSSEAVNRELNKMLMEGWIRHVIHTKLKTPAIYVTLKEPNCVTLKEPILWDLQKTWTELSKPQKNDKKELREEARKILEQAATVAKQRIKQKSSDSVKP